MSAEAVPDAELIERLTFVADILADQGHENWAADIRLAASRLAELQAERTRLREALDEADDFMRSMLSGDVGSAWNIGANALIETIRAALSASPIAPEDRPNG